MQMGAARESVVPPCCMLNDIYPSTRGTIRSLKIFWQARNYGNNVYKTQEITARNHGINIQPPKKNLESKKFW